jgi:hypothetical protein
LKLSTKSLKPPHSVNTLICNLRSEPWYFLKWTAQFSVTWRCNFDIHFHVVYLTTL